VAEYLGGVSEHAISKARHKLQRAMNENPALKETLESIAARLIAKV
jgi:hypothetical protein